MQTQVRSQHVIVINYNYAMEGACVLILCDRWSILWSTFPYKQPQETDRSFIQRYVYHPSSLSCVSLQKLVTTSTIKGIRKVGLLKAWNSVTVKSTSSDNISCSCPQPATGIWKMQKRKNPFFHWALTEMSSCFYLFINQNFALVQKNGFKTLERCTQD